MFRSSVNAFTNPKLKHARIDSMGERRWPAQYDKTIKIISPYSEEDLGEADNVLDSAGPNAVATPILPSSYAQWAAAQGPIAKPFVRDTSSDDSYIAPSARPPSTPPPNTPSPYTRRASQQPSMRRLPPIDPKPNRFSMYLVRFLAIAALLSWTFSMGGLFVAWFWIDDRSRYKWYLGQVPFISDVGAV